MDSTRVLVVGAGPVGLTLACGLAQHGVDVRVVDKADGPATTSRANILHARGIEVLDRAGALGMLPERAEPAVRMRLFTGAGQVFSIGFGAVDGSQVRALYISQAEIEAELRRRFAELGGTVEWKTALTDVSHDAGPGADGVTATFEDGRVVRADWLAGCDGGDSTVRTLAGFAFPGMAISEKFLLGDLYVRDWPFERDGGVMWYHDDGLLAAIPMPSPDGRRAEGDLWRFMAYLPQGSDERLTSDQILERFRQIVPRRSGQPDVALVGAEWTSVFRIQRRLVDEYRRGRVVLAGDAAHLHSPFGGQGMLTGIGDAENLAWKLALVVHGRANEALLDTYQAERRPLATEVLKNTSRGTWLQTSDSPLARVLARNVLAPVFARSAVQRRLTRMASQLGVTYRDGPLASATLGPRPRPGDRVPDLACERADGQPTRLHAELRGRWVLLVPQAGADGCLAPARLHLGEHVAMLTSHEHPSTQVWLVRPDGHLAWRGRIEPIRLERWLAGALLHGRAPK